MRWNCPHCEELVTAGIDFESTTKAYVRCARCNGMALIHRSAAVADYVKARRMDEEAQLETEIRLQQEMKQTQALQQSVRAQNLKMQTLQAQLQQATRDIESSRARATTEVNVDGRILSTPVLVTPPPFVQAKISLPVPPAFLIGSVEEAVRAFASEEAHESEDIFFVDPARHSRTDKASEASRLHTNLAVWMAAALALASGVYLYHEGKQALAPTIEVRAEN